MMRRFHLIGISTALALFASVLYTVYFPASYNKNGLVCISTNSYGEHWFEFVGIVIGLFIFLHFIWVNFKER